MRSFSFVRGRVLFPSLVLLLAGLWGGCDSADPGEAAPPRVALVDWEDGRPILYVQNIDGSERVRLRFTGAIDEIPGNAPDLAVVDSQIYALGPIQWSPDGQRLAVVAVLGHDQSEVVVVNRDGSGARTVSVNTQIITSDLDWSPDGRRLAYTMSTEPRASGIDLFVTDLERNEVERITEGQGLGIAGVELRWDAAGRGVYFTQPTGVQEDPDTRVTNFLTRLSYADVATKAVQTVAEDLVGEAQGIARSGAWVLLRRNRELGENEYRHDLVRRTVASGEEAVLVENETLRYAKVLDGDGRLLLAGPGPVTSENGYSFAILDLAGREEMEVEPPSLQVTVLDLFFEGE